MIAFEVAEPPPYARELLRESALANVDDDRDLRVVGVLAQRQVGHHGNQRRREVVHAVVAEVLERADRVRLPGAGHAGDDEEVGVAGATGGAARRLDRGVASQVAPVLEILVAVVERMVGRLAVAEA